MQSVFEGPGAIEPPKAACTRARLGLLAGEREREREREKRARESERERGINDIKKEKNIYV